MEHELWRDCLNLCSHHTYRPPTNCPSVLDSYQKRALQADPLFSQYYNGMWDFLINFLNFSWQILIHVLNFLSSCHILAQSGEILAVVSTSNRAEAVTNPKPARTPSIQSRSQESDAGPFWGRRWTRQWAYASYPHPSYHTHNQEQFRQQQQQQNWSRILIPSISDGMERRNEVLTHQRIFGQGRGDWVRPLPSYSGLGGLGPPPTYQDALALQRLRNSVRWQNWGLNW